MDKQEITALLESVAAGETPVEEAVLQLKTAPIREIALTPRWICTGDFARACRR